MDGLQSGRGAFRRQAWAEARAALASADREHGLGPDDLVSLGMAAFLVGRDEESADALGRAHREYLTRGDWPRAAASAFWVAFGLLDRGEHAQAGGWLARAGRVLDDHECDSVERGYLLLPRALQAAGRRDFAAALDIFGRAAAVGERFGDRDLVAIARHGQGRALVDLGRTAEGVALLDEAMAAVMTGEISPVIAGVVYCSVLSACHGIFDLRRAREWTAALTRWCANQPELVPFRGQCLIRRAEVLQLQGDWPDAVDEAKRARDVLTSPPARPGVGAAWYQLAELRRLRGELAEAEEAYRQASIAGRKPQPGLALLRLAQGQPDVAAAAIRRVLGEAVDPRTRPIALAAGVEILLAASQVGEARTVADELAGSSAESPVPFLQALSAGATGAVLLAEGRPRDALGPLREASAAWQELDAPYQAARIRVLVGLACRALHDTDTCAMELEAAGRTFRALGAAPDLARVGSLTRRPAPEPADGPLTGREREVLRLIATGKTNRAIAEVLTISEKTVARHVSNIFVKLGLNSRAAATAYAYEHGLNPPST
jgi:ATP/maltotriose-dependent transcriptional regulator MalT